MQSIPIRFVLCGVVVCVLAILTGCASPAPRLGPPVSDYGRTVSPESNDVLHDRLIIYRIDRATLRSSGGIPHNRRGEPIIDGIVDLRIAHTWVASLSDENRLQFGDMVGPIAITTPVDDGSTGSTFSSKAFVWPLGNRYFVMCPSEASTAAKLTEWRDWTGIILFARPGYVFDISAVDADAMRDERIRIEDRPQFKGIKAHALNVSDADSVLNSGSSKPNIVITVGSGAGYLYFSYIRSAEGSGLYFRRGSGTWISDVPNQVVMWNHIVQWVREETDGRGWIRRVAFAQDRRPGSIVPFREFAGTVGQRP